MLKIGETAPDFELPDQNGQSLSLRELLANGAVVLYFYPADFTPVCTREACAFRDRYDDLAALGTQVVGISPQDARSHKRFAETFALPFSLLCDTNKHVIRAYGVDGPLGFGVRRVTYLIEANGVVGNRVVSDLFLGSHLELIKQVLASGSG